MPKNCRLNIFSPFFDDFCENQQLINEYVIEQDKRLLLAFQTHEPKARFSALTEFYTENYGKIKRYVIQNSGTEDDAKDVFQEALTIVYLNVVNGKFKGESSVSTYFFSIVKNLWLLKLRKTRSKSFLAFGTVGDRETSTPTVEVNHHILSNAINELDENCRKILVSFYYEQRSMAELMKIFDLGSEQAAKNKKHHCLIKLMEIVKRKGLTKESFFE